jgi:hypothetical protein
LQVLSVIRWAEFRYCLISDDHVSHCPGVLLVTGFYEVGTFWVTATGAVISLGIGLLTAWIALKSAPKRRLFYGMSDPVALLTPEGSKHGLEVRRGGQPLSDPRLVDVTLQSSGRQSIDSAIFDQGRPLVLHFGVPIIEVLKADSRPPEQAVPDYQQSGSTLEVGPGVLAARQKITFSVLVDGQPSFSLISHLSDVPIRRQQISPEQMVRRRIGYTALAATFAAFAIFIGYTQVTTPSRTVAACYPLSNAGTCYEPGEFCRDSDHGATGVAGDGKKIICKDSVGWRWEPA